ncbi:NACHT, LRR and PYD domains-containing protein 1 isoform X1 [Mustela nigripes]|uniref:NACHT, LRR and PYD domains-containing protein 1 isoform X1 n=2 Tax=Mustela nigripes TaxID=77151 RepID=UPI00281602CE|nr:NACHT, LRR and PYD domains-containing protein 1 isoform X1 [Mustela nigripes]
MASGVQWRLARYLDMLGKEELKEFQLRLPEKPLGRPRPHLTSACGQQPGALEVASQLVAQHGEQQAWDLALHTWEQMGLSQLCAQARAEAALMSGEGSSLPCSPGAPSMQSPSGPTSTEVLSFVQDPPTTSSRQPPGTSRCFLQNRYPSFSFNRVLPCSSNQKSLLQESPSAPTSTTVLEDWVPPPQFSRKPRKQEAPRAEWLLVEMSGEHSKGIRERRQHQKRKRPRPTKSRGKEGLHEEFIELLLLHQPHGSLLESQSKGSWHHSGAEEQGRLIEVKDLFGPGLGAQEEGRAVVLHGVAGVGKSVMARQVRRAWEEGRLYRDRFQHVFYFSCRQLAQSKTMSLKELITKDWAAPTAPSEQILSQPGQLLLILDGLDELKWVFVKEKSEVCPYWDQPQPVKTLLLGLLRKTILPGASLLITARTTALHLFILSVEQPRWVKVLGFSESSRKEYFYKYFKSKNKANRAFHSVELNQPLLTMCLVPLVSWLVCTCMKKQMERGESLGLPSQTATALCLHYLAQALPAQPLGTQLRGLCSLAAKGIRQRETLLVWEDLRKHELEDTVSALLEMGILWKHPSSPDYNFAHQYLQEFFAAVSCVLGSEDKECHPPDSIQGLEDLLNVYGDFDPFEAPTTCFVLGLLSEPVQREMEAVFQGKVPVERKRKLLCWAEEEVRNQLPILQQSSLPMLHCLYEIQDKDFLTHAMAPFHGARVRVHTSLELLVFMFCIKFCTVKELRLNERGQHGHTGSPLHVALLRGFPVTDAWWEVLFFTLRTTGKLKELDLSGNCLSNTVVQSLCKALRFPSCCLETLRLTHCSLTAEGCIGLAWVLDTPETLTELELSFNLLLDLGVERLCNGLKEPGCRLHRLRLVGCGLTSRCCRALASALSASPRLTELDLQQNELEDAGVRLLCEGLRRPTCQLRLLWLDQTGLSEEVTRMLRALEDEKPPLLIPSRWKPSETMPNEGPHETVPNEDPRETMPNEGPHEGETSGTSSLQQDRRESEGLSPPVAQEGLVGLLSPAPPEDLQHTGPLGTEDDFWGPLGPVAIEMVDKDRSLHRVHLPMAGSYRWPSTGLRFVVREPATIDIEFCASDKFLHQMAWEQSWMVVGPLFDIKVKPGAVATVYLPHFVDLRGGCVDTSLFQVAHFKEPGMLLEKPNRVELYHVVLEDPSFSPLGVFLRTIHAALRFLPITSMVLLYHHTRPDETVFHLYLIPSDCCVRKAIDDEEKAFQFVQIRKPPPLASLYLGSRYTVSSSETLEAIPKELELCYRSPGQPQLYSEFYVGDLGSGLRLQLKDGSGAVVWEALVKPGDLQLTSSLVPPAPAASPAPPGAPASLHFLDRHREQLVARVTTVDPVLDKLLGQVLSEEQYERVRAKATAANQMRELFRFSRSWDPACKDQVYQALKETHPYLIMELWETWGGDRERGTSPPTQPLP